MEPKLCFTNLHLLTSKRSFARTIIDINCARELKVGGVKIKSQNQENAKAAFAL